MKRLFSVGAVGFAILSLVLSLAPAGWAEPVADHPRLWVRSDDVSRLRGWAVNTNPLYSALAERAAEAKAEMDAGNVPNGDTGGDTWVEYPTEMYAELFAFMSLISSDQATRDDYAERTRSLLMHVMNRAVQWPSPDPFCEPSANPASAMCHAGVF